MNRGVPLYHLVRINMRFASRARNLLLAVLAAGTIGGYALSAMAQVPKGAPPAGPGAAKAPGAKVPLPMPPGAKAAGPIPPGAKAPIPMPGGVPTTKTPPPQAKTAKDKSKSSDKPPPPEDITLETTDGISIRATWYLGTKKKESIPIIMVHGWEGSRGEYDGLARFLQSLGHSSVIPDLRGHGDSKIQKGPRGETKALEPDTFRPRDMESMVQDLEACKRFLMEKNNAGECNIEMLCLIGAEFGSILATRYAALDWSVPNLPAYKQGQDVKALVLLPSSCSHRCKFIAASPSVTPWPIQPCEAACRSCSSPATRTRRARPKPGGCLMLFRRTIRESLKTPTRL
jgi:hypothetical protein